MTQEFLDGPDVIVRLQKVCGKAVSRVWTGIILTFSTKTGLYLNDTVMFPELSLLKITPKIPPIKYYFINQFCKLSIIM
jgi:hypothetical protein